MPTSNKIFLIEITDSNYLLIENLVEESKQEGFELVQRTIDDWESGANRFSKQGECLWGAVSGKELIGLCGLNRDPYTQDANIGRVRHLYVSSTYRRHGCATLLMKAVINKAQLHFHTLRLFTSNPIAAAFYENLGFQLVDEYKVSHVMEL